MSRQQQDLTDTTLLCRCLSFGRFTERQFQANRDYQLAISHRFGHELERFPVEFREYFHHLYRWVLRGVLRCPDNRCIDSARLDLGDQLLSGSPAHRIRHRIERRKIRNRGVVVGCNELDPRRPSSRSSICLFKTPAITVAPRDFAVNTAERPTFPTAPTTRTVWATLISVAERSWLPVTVTSGNAAASIKSSPLGTFARTAAFTTQSSA